MGGGGGTGVVVVEGRVYAPRERPVSRYSDHWWGIVYLPCQAIRTNGG